MKALKIVLQILGILLLVPAVALATLSFNHRNSDGPSLLFPGGELVSGDLYSGVEPDWTFTNEIQTIELQLEDPLSSRLIWITETEGKIYVISKFMNTAIGRIWKHWAVAADERDGLAVVRIGDTRYQRRIVRIHDSEVPYSLATRLTEKYGRGDSSPQAIAVNRRDIETGNTWVFELAPRM
ncbi:MAG: hypothetical protein ACJZ8E_05255 [Pseudohongiellaceae bacterium]